MLDYSKLTYLQMAEIVQEIRNEVKKRNPLFVNAHTPTLDQSVETLMYLHEGKEDNPDYDEQ